MTKHENVFDPSITCIITSQRYVPLRTGTQHEYESDSDIDRVPIDEILHLDSLLFCRVSLLLLFLVAAV